MGDKRTTAATARLNGPIANVTYNRSDEIRAARATYRLNFGTEHRPRHALGDGADSWLEAGPGGVEARCLSSVVGGCGASM